MNIFIVERAFRKYVYKTCFYLCDNKEKWEKNKIVLFMKLISAVFRKWLESLRYN